MSGTSDKLLRFGELMRTTVVGLGHVITCCTTSAPFSPPFVCLDNRHEGVRVPQMVERWPFKPGLSILTTSAKWPSASNVPPMLHLFELGRKILKVQCSSQLAFVTCEFEKNQPSTKQLFRELAACLPNKTILELN